MTLGLTFRSLRQRELLEILRPERGDPRKEDEIVVKKRDLIRGRGTVDK